MSDRAAVRRGHLLLTLPLTLNWMSLGGASPPCVW